MKGRGLVIAALFGLWLAVAVHGGHLSGEHSGVDHEISVPPFAGRWAAAKFSALDKMTMVSARSARSALPLRPSTAASARGRAQGSGQRVASPGLPATASGNWLVAVACVAAIVMAAGAAAMTALGIRTAK
jgi:hypothetical protein